MNLPKGSEIKTTTILRTAKRRPRKAVFFKDMDVGIFRILSSEQIIAVLTPRIQAGAMRDVKLSQNEKRTVLVVIFQFSYKNRSERDK